MSNGGAPLADVTLVDDKLGAIGDPIALLPTQGSQSFTVEATLLETKMNRIDAAGSGLFGSVCTASDEVTVTRLRHGSEAG